MMVYSFFDEDSCDVTFCCDERSILNVNLNNINLDNGCDDDDSHTIILIKHFAGHSKCEKYKVIKKR